MRHQHGAQRTGPAHGAQRRAAGQQKPARQHHTGQNQAGGQQRQHKRGRRSAGLVQLVFPVKVLGKLRFGFGKLLGKALACVGKRKFLLFAKQSLEECALVIRRGLRNICLFMQHNLRPVFAALCLNGKQPLLCKFIHQGKQVAVVGAAVYNIAHFGGTYAAGRRRAQLRRNACALCGQRTHQNNQRRGRGKAKQNGGRGPRRLAGARKIALGQRGAQHNILPGLDGLAAHKAGGVLAYRHREGLLCLCGEGLHGAFRQGLFKLHTPACFLNGHFPVCPKRGIDKFIIFRHAVCPKIVRVMQRVYLCAGDGFVFRPHADEKHAVLAERFKGYAVHLHIRHTGPIGHAHRLPAGGLFLHKRSLQSAVNAVTGGGKIHHNGLCHIHHGVFVQHGAALKAGDGITGGLCLLRPKYGHGTHGQRQHSGQRATQAFEHIGSSWQ